MVSSTKLEDTDRRPDLENQIISGFGLVELETSLCSPEGGCQVSRLIDESVAQGRVMG